MNQTKTGFIPYVKLNEFNIGQVSGENEARSENFEELFFTGNKKYEELKKPEKYIIMGRKGTGKTLLAYYFKRKALENNLKSCKISTLKDYQLMRLIHLEDRDFFEEECKALWKYCILINLAKSILNEKNIAEKLFNPNIRKLNKFISKDNLVEYKLIELNKTAGHIKKKSRDSKSSAAYSKSTISSTLTGSAGLYKEKNTTMSEKYVRNEYYNNIEAMESLIFKILNKEEKGYVIIFDDLDELGDNVEKPQKYRSSILSMISVVQEFNMKIQDINTYSKIIISIRSDILNSLNEYSSNLRKIIADNSVDLYWLTKSHSKITDYLLIDLILTKIKASVKEYSNIEKEILFNALFPKYIFTRKISDFLLDYSMGRPRQIIEYLNIIIKNYPNENRFTEQHFKQCLKYFSAELYKDLQNEFSVYENKEELNDSMRLIKDLRKSGFRYGQIIAHYNVNKNKYKHIKSVDDSLNYMYLFGVIGTYNKSNRMYSWGYRNDSDDSINKDDIIIVNYALKHKFNIK